MASSGGVPLPATLAKGEDPKDGVLRVNPLIFKIGMQGSPNYFFHRLPGCLSPLSEKAVLGLRDLRLNECHSTYNILHFI